LFNGMIHRLTPFAIRGALWYQGEGNVGDGMKYYHKMRALIGGWREAWGQGQFPFLYVQLTPYDYGMYKGSKDPYKLPALWEAQTAALAVPNTGMVVTTDISDVKNIHPPNKQEVGNRLARWALNGTYGKTDVPYRGPMFHHFTVEPNQIRVVFDPGDGVLKSRDDKPLSWFTVAGDDRVFHPAEATIESNSVVVRSSEVLTPRHVRFAWHKLAEPNLANKAGLPAVPFRTDSWTVQTGLED
jgi:sialate O-acetylesterase